MSVYELKTSIRIKKLDGDMEKVEEYLQSVCNFADYYNTEVTVKCALLEIYEPFGFEPVGTIDDEGIYHMVRFPNKGRVTE